jgi:ketosteroid isomerase-like protein
MVTKSAELEQVVAAWFDAACRGDAAAVARHVSSDDATCLIGSDPAEWFRGSAAVMAFLEGEIKGAGGAARFIPSQTEAFSEGSVGWATTRLTIRLAGRQIAPRWSAVFHREDGAWKMVQVHASIGITNEQVGWTYDS